MARTTQQKAQRNQQREQNKKRLLKGIQDAGGILPLDTPDTAQSTSQPAQPERAVFILHQDLEVRQHTHDTLREKVRLSFPLSFHSSLACTRSGSASCPVQVDQLARHQAG